MREKIVQEKNFYYIKLYNIYIYTEYICINNQDELKFVFSTLILVYHTNIYLNQFDSYTCIIV